jgi:AAA domain, putative AbiEii toxin, Type IV TA system
MSLAKDFRAEMMKIVLKNIGVLTSEVEIAPAALTIFTGGNNTGKTYAMVVLWALLAKRFWPDYSFANALLARIQASGSVQIPLSAFYAEYWHVIEADISTALRQHLPTLFGAAPRFFQHSQIDVTLNQSALTSLAQTTPNYGHSVEFGKSGKLDMRFTMSGDDVAIAITAVATRNVPDEILAQAISAMITAVVLDSYTKGAFLLPAERGGLNLVYDDLWSKGSSNRQIPDVPEQQRALMVIRHAEPIEYYVQFLKSAKRLLGLPGKFHDQAQALQRDIARVQFKVSEEGIVTATPDQDNGIELGIHLTSSTVKNLYGLWAWLESIAAPGAWLMIDEPELNLHPDNQRLVARLLARLVNRGIRVVISTHSDYIVREVNNMIMLGSEFPERAAMETEFGYDASGAERLRAEDVAAWHFTDKGVDQCAISPEFGIEVQSMDDAINRLNQSNSAIYYALGEKLHPMIESSDIQTD